MSPDLANCPLETKSPYWGAMACMHSVTPDPDFNCMTERNLPLATSPFCHRILFSLTFVRCQWSLCVTVRSTTKQRCCFPELTWFFKHFLIYNNTKKKKWTKRPKTSWYSRNPSLSHFAHHKTKMVQTDLFPDSDYRKKVIQELCTDSFHILIRNLEGACSRMGQFCLYVLSRHLGTTGPRIMFLYFCPYGLCFSDTT